MISSFGSCNPVSWFSGGNLVRFILGMFDDQAVE